MPYQDARTYTPGSDPQRAALIEELRADEGEVLHAYEDHLGYVTIGVGRMIDKRKGGGISKEESAYLLSNDIDRIEGELDRALPWWRALDPVRRRAVVNMVFQMGIGTVGGASTMALIRSGDYDAAADRLEGWKWASQTPARAARVIAMIRTGKP